MLSARDIALAIMVAAIWGLNFIAIKLAVAEMPPLMVAAMRFALAAFPAVLFVKPPKTEWWITVLFGLFLGFGLYLFLNVAMVWGMPGGLSSLVLQVQVLFTIIISFFWFGEKPRPIQIAGGAIAFVGIGVLAAGHGELAALIPFFMTVAGALSWAVANALTKRAGDVDPIAFTVWGSLVAPVPLMAVTLVMDGPAAIVAGWQALDAGLWVNLLYQAYPTTLIGLAIWSNLLKRYPAVMVTPFALLVPVTGLLAGYLVLGEPLNAIQAVGAVIVMVGLATTVVRLRRVRGV